MIALLLAIVGRLSDHELVQRFQAGDRDAYAEIVRRYQNRVYTMCVRWMRDDRVAEEVAQDVFVALYRALPSFRGDARLSTWVYRVVVNHCKNRLLYRKRRAHDRHEPLEGNPTDDGPERQLAGDGPEPDSLRHRTEAEHLVEVGLSQLDDEQRTIIVLRDIEDRSYEEIADIMGVPRGTVKSRLHRARAQLATVLGRKIREEDVF